MVLAVLQKTTMIDYPGKMACTIFTKGCDFRCPFCHNSSLVLDEDNENEVLEADILSFLEKRKKLLDGVCISGGEPLLQKDLVEFLGKIKAMGYLIKLDTNGNSPKKLQELISKKLIDYVAMDIKNSPENYGKAIGIKVFDIKNVNESIAILKSNQLPYELRTTIVKGIHQIEDFQSIGKWIHGAQNYYLQNYEDSGNVIASKTKENHLISSFNKKDLERFVEVLKKDVPNTQIRSI